jgi:hypothetical protein
MRRDMFNVIVERARRGRRRRFPRGEKAYLANELRGMRRAHRSCKHLNETLAPLSASCARTRASAGEKSMRRPASIFAPTVEFATPEWAETGIDDGVALARRRRLVTPARRCRQRNVYASAKRRLSKRALAERELRND